MWLLLTEIYDAYVGISPTKKILLIFFIEVLRVQILPPRNSSYTAYCKVRGTSAVL